MNCNPLVRFANLFESPCLIPGMFPFVLSWTSLSAETLIPWRSKISAALRGCCFLEVGRQMSTLQNALAKQQEIGTASSEILGMSLSEIQQQSPDRSIPAFDVRNVKQCQETPNEQSWLGII
jgi:hypothetical protein